MSENKTKQKNTNTAKTVIVDKEYRLSDDQSGLNFFVKTGRNRQLLVFDSEINLNRPIRHCPNEKSIFVDEQSEHAVVEPIIFERGFLKVKSTSQITQKFLELHPSNTKNGGSIFEEIIEGADDSEILEIEDLILDLKSAVRTKAKAKDGLQYLSMVVGALDGDISKVSQMSEEALKRRLYAEIDDRPYRFTDDKGNVNLFDNEELHRRYIALTALNDGVVTRSPIKRAILWGDTKETIVLAPMSIDLVDYFVEFLSTDEGIKVLEEIKKKS